MSTEQKPERPEGWHQGYTAGVRAGRAQAFTEIALSRQQEADLAKVKADQEQKWADNADLNDPDVRIMLTEQAWQVPAIGGPLTCEDYGVDVLEMPEHSTDFQIGYSQASNLKVEGWPLPRLKKDRPQSIGGEWTEDQGRTLAGMKVLCLKAGKYGSLEETWHQVKEGTIL